MTLRKHLQRTLGATGVPTFWKRRVAVKGQKDPVEYIVYTLSGDYGRTFADGGCLILERTATVRYYCRADRFGTEAGREAAEQRVDELLAALRAAGFDLPSGAFDAGDIDDTGYDATVLECSFREVL